MNASQHFYRFRLVIYVLGHMACGISEIEPVYPAWAAWSLNHWTAREIPPASIIKVTNMTAMMPVTLWVVNWLVFPSWLHILLQISLKLNMLETNNDLWETKNYNLITSLHSYCLLVNLISFCRILAKEHISHNTRYLLN